MKKFTLVFSLLVLFSTLSFGQTNPDPSVNVATNNGQFTLAAKVMALSANGTTVATDIGATFAVTTTISLRSDNVLVPAGQQGYFGGVQYFLSSPKILSKTNFDPATFQFYLTASGGYVLNGVDKHAGWLAGGGLNYDPTRKGRFTVNVVEVRAARLPGVANGVVPLVSGGINLGW